MPAVATISATGLATAVAASGATNITASQNGITSTAVVLTATPPLTLATTGLPSGNVGRNYSSVLSATGGTAPLTWSITSGSLPPVLSLDPTTGQISGPPSAIGSFTFTAQVVDSGSPRQTATGLLSIAISPPPLEITTTTLPSTTMGFKYQFAVLARGGVPPYTWALSSGSLPTGFNLDQSGNITGTSSGVGIYTFRVTVTDASAVTSSAGLSLSIAAPNNGGPTPGSDDTIVFQDNFESGTLSKWAVDPVTSNYTISTHAKTGQFSVQGNIPAGLASGEMDALFMPGYDEIYVRLDAQFSAGFLNGANGAGLHWVSLRGNDVNNPFSANGQNGIRPSGTDFFLSDAMPETATQTGSQSLLPMEFSTQWPEMSCPSDYNPSTNPDCFGNPITQTPPLTNANDGQWHTYVFHMKDNSIGNHDGLQEMWIDGQKVISQTGMLWRTGTNLLWNELALQLDIPVSPQAQNIWVDNVVIWSPGTGDSTPLSITTNSLPAGTLGAAYVATLTAFGGSAPYTWSVSGALPQGLSLNASTGVISGIPTEAETVQLLLMASDSDVQTAIASDTLTTGSGQFQLPDIFSDGFENVADRTCVNAGDGATCVPGNTWADVIDISASSYVQTGCHSGLWCGAMTQPEGSDPQHNQSSLWDKAFSPPLSPGTGNYFRIWYKLPIGWQLPDFDYGNWDFKAMIFETGNVTNHAYLNFRNQGDNLTYAIGFLRGADAWILSTDNFTVDGNWHAVEVEIINSPTPHVNVWLDGKQEINSDLAGAVGNIFDWKFGGFYNSQVHPTEIFYIDDVAVSSHRIGL